MPIERKYDIKATYDNRELEMIKTIDPKRIYKIEVTGEEYKAFLRGYHKLNKAKINRFNKNTSGFTVEELKNISGKLIRGDVEDLTKEQVKAGRAYIAGHKAKPVNVKLIDGEYIQPKPKQVKKIKTVDDIEPIVKESKPKESTKPNIKVAVVNPKPRAPKAPVKPLEKKQPVRKVKQEEVEDDVSDESEYSSESSSDDSDSDSF